MSSVYGVISIKLNNAINTAVFKLFKSKLPGLEYVVGTESIVTQSLAGYKTDVTETGVILFESTRMVTRETLASILGSYSDVNPFTTHCFTVTCFDVDNDSVVVYKNKGIRNATVGKDLFFEYLCGTTVSGVLCLLESIKATSGVSLQRKDLVGAEVVSSLGLDSVYAVDSFADLLLLLIRGDEASE